MKKAGKPISIIVILLVFAFTYLSVFGAENYFGEKRIIYFRDYSDIRLGMDVGGGWQTVFTPETEDGTVPEMEQLEEVKQKLMKRMVALGLTDFDININEESGSLTVHHQNYDNDNIIVAESLYDMGQTGLVQICSGSSNTTVLADSNNGIKRADVMYDAVNGYYLRIYFTSSGSDAMAAGTNGASSLSVWVDGQSVASSSISEAVTNGQINITMSDEYDAYRLAGLMNSGPLPVEFTTETYDSFAPTMGDSAVLALVIAAGVLILAAIILLIVKYRLPGIAASIALIGQAAGIMAVLTGFFSPISPATLTLPVAAAVLISMFMGVSTAMVTASNIKSEINNDRTIDGAVITGYQRALPGLISSSVAIAIIAVVLMGAFGPGSSFTARIFSNIFFFGAPTEGHVYYFAYVLFGGVLFNLFMNAVVSRIILRGLSSFRALRRPSLYGGVNND